MVENFPFTGVGIDNYGSYFKQYRDVGYPLKYGWDLTSTNAHNLPLQMFSTGGVPLGLFFLLITLFVFYVGIKNIKKYVGAERYLSLGIFLAWLAYQLQLLVSVDNVAMAIWGWILSGIIIALFSNSDQMEAIRIESVRAGREKQLLLSSIILLPILFISFNQLKAESNMYKLMGGFKPENQATAEGFKTFANSALKVPYLDPTYKLTIGSYLVDYGDSDNGLRAVDEVLQKNSRNLQAYWVKATNFENKQNFEQAIIERKKIEELDPWNAKNFYIMVLDYKSLGNEIQAKFYGDKIKSFAQNTDIGKQLISNFPNL